MFLYMGKVMGEVKKKLQGGVQLTATTVQMLNLQMAYIYSHVYGEEGFL